MAEVKWSPGQSLGDLERRVIKSALAHFKNRDECAVSLGISRRTLDTRISELRVDDSSVASEVRMGSGLAARYNPKMDTSYLDAQKELKKIEAEKGNKGNGKNPPAN